MSATAAGGRASIVHRPAIRPALFHSIALLTASLVSYWLTTHVLAAIHSVSEADDKLGAMWSVIGTVFVYRFGYQESVTVAISRVAATLLSFALCLAYLLVLPFNPLGMAGLIGLGTLILMIIGREEDVITAGITTAVVMVVAGLNPRTTGNNRFSACSTRSSGSPSDSQLPRSPAGWAVPTHPSPRCRTA